MTDEVIEQAATETTAAATPTTTAAPDSPAAAEAGKDTPAVKTEEAAVEPIWRADWREKMAGDLADTATDEEKSEHTKLLKRLQRFNSPADAAKALREQDKLISSGQLKKALPKNATPEQVKAWRTENGIPESADKYDLGVPADAELIDLQKDMLQAYAAKMHEANASPEVVKAGVASILEYSQRVAEQMQAANAEAKSEATETLRAEWGADYKPNIDGVDSLLRNAPTAVAEAIYGARLPNGVQVMNDPEVVRWLAGHARELGYVGATVVPQGGDLGKTIEDEIASVEKSMFNEDGTKNKAYWGSDSAQKRYSDLLESQKRRASK